MRDGEVEMAGLAGGEPEPPEIEDVGPFCHAIKGSFPARAIPLMLAGGP